MVNEISNAQEFAEAIAYDGLTVVDFYATWCGPCKVISPFLDKLATEYSQVKFVKVDVDAVSDVAADNEISHMPTLLFFKKGTQIAKVIGAQVAQIQQVVKENA